MSVLDLLRECRDQAEEFGRIDAHYRAKANERLFHGISAEERYSAEQFAEASVYRNYLRGMVNTWSARALEDRPMIKAYPTHAEAKDLGAAEVANALMEYQYQKQALDRMFWEAAKYVQLHGKVGFKVSWDASKGDEIWAPALDELSGMQLLDEESGQPMQENLGPEGDVSWDLVTIFDYDYGGSDRVADADWCCFYRYIDRYHAQSIIQSERGKLVELDEEFYTDPSGYRSRGVEVVELWYRPGPRIPDGLYALSVGGYLAVCEPYPYEHGQLPLAEWRIDQIRGTPWATSHVDDAVPLQKLINEKEAAKAETVRKTGTPKLLALPEIQESWEEGVHSIAVDSVNSVQQGAKYVEPPEPNALVFGTQQEDVQNMFNVFGLNEVLTGKDSAKSGTSAKQIAYLNKLDSMKISGAIRELEDAMIRGWRQTLSLSRQYVEAERLLKIVGPGGEMDLQHFSGVSLDGVDLILEPQTGAERFRAQAAAEAEQDLQSGKASPHVAMERAETGLGTSMNEAALQRTADQMVMAAYNGQPVQPDPNIPPVIALRAIYRAMGSGNPQTDQALQQLANAYQQMAAQQQGPPQGAPNAQSQPPGRGPGPRGPGA